MVSACIGRLHAQDGSLLLPENESTGVPASARANADARTAARKCDGIAFERKRKRSAGVFVAHARARRADHDVRVRPHQSARRAREHDDRTAECGSHERCYEVGMRLSQRTQLHGRKHEECNVDSVVPPVMIQRFTRAHVLCEHHGDGARKQHPERGHYVPSSGVTAATICGYDSGPSKPRTTMPCGSITIVVGKPSAAYTRPYCCC